MPSRSPHTEPTSTLPHLFLVMSGGVIGFGAVEIGLLAVGAWWVLPVLMATLVLTTGGVVLAVARALDGSDGPRTPVAAREPEPEPAAAPAPQVARRPAGARLVPGH